MRKDWRYLAQRLNGDGTATFLDIDVPLTDVGIEDALNGSGGLTGKIDPEVARLKGDDGLPIFDEQSTALFAEKDGLIRGGGILTHSGMSGSEWALECTGHVGYPKKMPYTGNGVHYEYTDTLDIYRAIWAHLQDQVPGNIGLTFDTTKSGVLVGKELASEEYDPEGGAGGLTLQSQSYKLEWFADHDLDSNLNALAEDTPFDFHQTYFWTDSGQIQAHVEFGVPVLGRRRENLRFVIGENILVKPGVDRAGEDYADEVYVLGAGEGASMIRGHAVATQRRRLRRVVTISDPGLSTLARANSVARSELAWRNRLGDISSVVVRDTDQAPLGSMGVGDEIYIGGRTDWVEVNDWFRILNIAIRPNDPNVMELALARSDRIAS
jgi:hypothetical protein